MDGKHNPKIQSVYLDGFPIHTAHFSTDGREVIMGSKYRNFQYYDMMAGKIVNVPRIKGRMTLSFLEAFTVFCLFIKMGL